MMDTSDSIAMEGIEYHSTQKHSKFPTSIQNESTFANFQVTIVLSFRYPTTNFDPDKFTTHARKMEAYKLLADMKEAYKAIDRLCRMDCDAPEGSVKKTCWGDLQRRDQIGTARVLFMRGETSVSLPTCCGAIPTMMEFTK